MAWKLWTDGVYRASPVRERGPGATTRRVLEEGLVTAVRILDVLRGEVGQARSSGLGDENSLVVVTPPGPGSKASSGRAVPHVLRESVLRSLAEIGDVYRVAPEPGPCVEMTEGG